MGKHKEVKEEPAVKEKIGFFEESDPPKSVKRRKRAAASTLILTFPPFLMQTHSMLKALLTLKIFDLL